MHFIYAIVPSDAQKRRNVSTLDPTNNISKNRLIWLFLLNDGIQI